MDDSSRAKINFESYQTARDYTKKNHQALIDGTSGVVHGYKNKINKLHIGESICRSLVG